MLSNFLRKVPFCRTLHNFHQETDFKWKHSVKDWLNSLLLFNIAGVGLRITSRLSGRTYFNYSYSVVLNTSIPVLKIVLSPFYFYGIHCFIQQRRLRAFLVLPGWLFVWIGLVYLNNAYSTRKKSFSLKTRILGNICAGDLKWQT